MTQAINSYNDYLVFSTSHLNDSFSSLLEDKYTDVSLPALNIDVYTLTILELLSFANPIPNEWRIRLDEHSLLTFQLLDT